MAWDETGLPSTFDYTLHGAPNDAWVEVKDVQGRTVERMQVNNAKGQLVWDTHQIPAGVYTVELINDGKRLHTEKLIVKP